MSSVEIDSLLALIGISLFWFKNPHRKLIVLTSSFVLVLFLSEWFLIFGNMLVGQIIWGLGAIGLSIAYFLRFNAKKLRGTWDFLKWIAIVFVLAYPWTLYEDDNYLTVLRLLAFPVLTTMYLYDRVVFKPERMKTKFIVILVAQSVLLILMTAYSVLLHIESNRLRQAMEEQRNESIRLRHEMEERRVISDQPAQIQPDRALSSAEQFSQK
jgi:hypothetical protein